MNDRYFKMSFRMIRRAHDGWLIHKLVDPEQVLKRLCMKEGDVVFEIGCGPGFYTVGASRIVGHAGVVYAYDINPYAIRHVENKIENQKLCNVRAVEGNANNTAIENNAVDFAFVFGVPRIVGGIDGLVDEINRVLKPSGILVWNVRKSSVEEFDAIMGKRGYEIVRSGGRYRTYRLQNNDKSAT